MYRLGIEAILGINRVGQTLRINPCIPRHWTDFALTYRDGATHYEIRVVNPNGVNRGVKHISMDGASLPDGAIPLLGDAQRHQVRVEMGRNDELTSPAVPRQAEEDHAGQS
jgi:cyclic beta-1,2-glucan synthetase